MGHRTNNHGYEFDSRENELIAKLAGAMRFVGTLALFGGFAATFLTFLDLIVTDSWNWAMFINGIIDALIGRWLRDTAHFLDNVARTEGADIGNLMVALTDLTRIYELQRVAMIVKIVLIVGVLGALGITMRALHVSYDLF